MERRALWESGDGPFHQACCFRQPPHLLEALGLPQGSLPALGSPLSPLAVKRRSDLRPALQSRGARTVIGRFARHLQPPGDARQALFGCHRPGIEGQHATVGLRRLAPATGAFVLQSRQGGGRTGVARVVPQGSQIALSRLGDPLRVGAQLPGPGQIVAKVGAVRRRTFCLLDRHGRRQPRPGLVGPPQVECHPSQKAVTRGLLRRWGKRPAQLPCREERRTGSGGVARRIPRPSEQP
jgi:hypothetical protein